MQQFVIIAYDATDAGAFDRRMAAREAHMEAMAQARKNGQMICGVALLDEAGKMIGSNIVVNMPDRASVDAWLAAEPYVTGKVWEKITVLPAKIGQTFQDLIIKQ